MNVVKQAVLATGLLGLAAAGYLWGPSLLDGGSGANGGGGPGGQAAPRVITSPLTLEPERTVIEAIGTAEANLSADLHPAASGEVVAIHITPDKAVDKGDVLLELDHRAEELAVDLARVRVDDARRLLTRYERTKGTGAVPESTVDEARAALETARIELRQAQVDLDDRTLTAPFAGRVDTATVDLGDRVGPEDRITTLDDRSSLLVKFPLPEAFLDRLTIGSTVMVSPGLSRDRAIEGTIVDLGSRIDPLTRSVQARARVANPDDRLRPGMSFTVHLELRGETYGLVPEVAVQWGGDGPYLWVVRGGAARRVPVQIIQRQEGTTLIDGAVQDGELIVVEGIQRMREGTPVTLSAPGS